MNETRWTPGPWHHAGFTVYAMEGNVPGRYRRMDCRVQTDRCLASAIEQEANVRLIAAAPDLYKALEQFAAVARPHPHIEGQYLILTAHLDRALNAARAALSRARGEQNEGGTDE